MDLSLLDVPGWLQLLRGRFLIVREAFVFVFQIRVKFLFHCFLLQVLTIIAFHSGNINLSTIKVALSVGPAYFILNFIESMFLLELTIAHSTNLLHQKYSWTVTFLYLLHILGCLDILLMFGAYKSARGFAISRLIIRFFWFGVSSAFTMYLYL